MAKQYPANNSLANKNPYALIIKKIQNQINKLNLYFENREMKKFKAGFKFCGENVSIQQPVRLEGKESISIGNNVSINSFVHMWGHGKIVIGNDCLIASHVSINSLTHDTNATRFRDTIVKMEVVIGNNVWIGSHAVILPGIIIGDNCIIGAGAVVTKNVATGTTVAGVPAKVIKHVEGN